MTGLSLGRHVGYGDVDAEGGDWSRCPANECGRPTRGAILCGRHWRLLPDDPLAALGAAYEAYVDAKTAGDVARTHGAAARWDAAFCRCLHAAEVHPRG